MNGSCFVGFYKETRAWLVGWLPIILLLVVASLNLCIFELHYSLSHFHSLSMKTVIMPNPWDTWD
jgi:hypothetical protein